MNKKILRLSDAMEKLPRCRLCEKFMDKLFDSERKVFIYACRPDGWAIRADDPFLVGWDNPNGSAWDRAEAAMKKDPEQAELFDCPHCRATMRFVCTSTGYMQFKCVKTAKRGCGMKAEMKEPDRKDRGTNIGIGVKDLVLDLTPEEKERFS